MKAGINYVMLKIDRSYDELRSDTYTTKSGLIINRINNSNNPDYAGQNCSHGEVVNVGELRFDKDNYQNMKWKTRNELQKGDIAIYYYNANCWETGEFYVEGQMVYFFIRYHNIYCVIRDGKIIPVNGYNLIEPIEENPSEKLWTPEKKSKKYGYVRYIGEPLEDNAMTEYSDEVARLNGKEHVGYGLKEGDFVILEKWSAKPIMFPTQNIVGNYYVSHRFGMVAVIEDTSRIKL